MCAYWCEDIVDQKQWWIQGIWNGSLIGHMDGILNQERRSLTKYNQGRSLLGHNIGMEVYIFKSIDHDIKIEFNNYLYWRNDKTMGKNDYNVEMEFNKCLLLM